MIDMKELEKDENGFPILPNVIKVQDLIEQREVQNAFRNTVYKALRAGKQFEGVWVYANSNTVTFKHGGRSFYLVLRANPKKKTYLPLKQKISTYNSITRHRTTHPILKDSMPFFKGMKGVIPTTADFIQLQVAKACNKD